MLAIAEHDRDSAAVLARYFTREDRKRDTYLFRQGDPGDALYLLGEGSVAVVAEADGDEHVIRHYRAGAMIGEMSIHTGDARSASVLVEADTTLYRMDADDLRRLQRDHPAVAEQLIRYTVRVLSERLRRASRELQRLM